MARQLLTVGSLDSDGVLFKAGTPVEGAMGEFVAIDEMTLDEPPVPVYDEGQEFMNDGDKRTFIAVYNGGVLPTTLTIQTYGTVDGMTIADRTVVVGSDDMVLVRPGPASVYNQPNGMIYFSLDPIDSVTVAVVKVAP